MIQFTTKISDLENMELQNEYKLEYFFGVWITSEVIWASTDEEAIFDANRETDKLTYRLKCGKRIVKEWSNKYNNELNNY